MTQNNPSAENPTPDSAPAKPEPKKLTREGLTIVKRSNKPDAKYMTRIRFKGKVHEITLAETAKDSFDIAVRARREIHAGRWTELKPKIALRRDCQAVKEVFAVYREFKGPDRPAESTIELNINALTAIVRETLGDTTDVGALPLTTLSADLIWKWKEGKRKLAGEAANDERAMQILRSANSRMRQARSIFSDNEDLRTFYRHHKIELPVNIAAFCTEPPFADCSKDEYHAPSDQIIAATFAALEKLGQSDNPDDVNMFKACWLAIGFGLRKSEIAVARNNWFQDVDGTIFCRGDELAKNKKFPEVRVQLNAWDKLKTLLVGDRIDPKATVMVGTKTERTDICFRRLSEWMRGLGWETTHHVHEFRAWAGCQIAMAPGNTLREAQTFMRHASYATTEKFYGHHLKIKLSEVKLSIPTLTKKEFNPVVLPDAAQAS